MRKTGWLVFVLWAVPGMILGLQVSAIGVLLVPVGLLAIFLIARSSRVWPEVLGSFEGVAAACFLVVALHFDYWSCPPSGEVTTRTKGSVVVESCEGLNPWPWLVAGLVFAVGGAVGFAVAKCPGGMESDGKGNVPVVG